MQFKNRITCFAVAGPGKNAEVKNAGGNCIDYHYGQFILRFKWTKSYDQFDYDCSQSDRLIISVDLSMKEPTERCSLITADPACDNVLPASRGLRINGDIPD